MVRTQRHPLSLVCWWGTWRHCEQRRQTESQAGTSDWPHTETGTGQRSGPSGCAGGQSTPP